MGREAAALVTLGLRSVCSCAGFSFTHAVPMCDGRALPGAIRRINVGGKALTNYFKELVSYRYAFCSDVLAPLLAAAI